MEEIRMAHQEALFNIVKQYLDSQGWNYTSDINRYRFDFSMGIGGKLNSCRMIIAAEDNGIVFLAFSPLNADEASRASVAEYLTRANYGLKSGNFEMDYSDGEIHYKNYLRCSETIPSLSEVEFTTDICFLMFKKYGDGLAKNLFGFGDPARDYDAAEGNR